jgi:hypothetical protein
MAPARAAHHGDGRIAQHLDALMPFDKSAEQIVDVPAGHDDERAGVGSVL